jgi:hypothetical protein
LRYRLNADGSFTLYGVGPNHADDGGIMAAKTATQDLDWVWPLYHPTEERRLFREPRRAFVTNGRNEHRSGSGSPHTPRQPPEQGPEA